MNKIIIYITLVFLSITACKNQQPEVLEVESDLIKITKEQFQTENMEFGHPEQVVFENRLHFTGKIIPSMNGMAKISVPIEGLIKKTYVQKGQKVKAGQLILEIGGNTLIDLQQSLSISAAKMHQLKSDFERTHTLYKDHIKTENEFMLAESAFKSELAHYNALKIKLQNIGLNITAIENGSYASSYKITSPIDGHITDINAIMGQFVSPQQDIAEIVNPDKSQLQIAVFERDYMKIKIGQKVHFKTSGDQDHFSSAIITRISKMMNTETKSFDCYAQITSSSEESYLINQLLSADVIIKSDTVYALPQRAILGSGNNHYILVKESETPKAYLLKKTKTSIGRTHQDFIELLNTPKDKMILVSGTYNMSIE